jgi:aryl-alcohol dehydrogenase-like predicted oxidoreductase
MEYRTLGSSGVKVSEIALGAGNFGKRVDQATSTNTVDYALAQGVNYIDTADWYGDGTSEICLGNALKGRRQQVILSTKFGSGVGDGINERGASRYHIIDAVEKSLQRLQTDYIDLYQIHIPDPETPIEETLRAMDDLVRTGKVRYIGCSDHAAWQICEVMWCSRLLNLEHFVTAQMRYNLLDRNIEEELLPCCRKYNVGILPWNTLAGGFLTGKYRRNEPPPPGTRMTNPPLINTNTMQARNFDKLEKLEAFTTTHDYDIGKLAIMWLLAKPWVTSVLSGPMNVSQMELYVQAAEQRLSTEEVAELDEITSWQDGESDCHDLSFLLKSKPVK